MTRLADTKNVPGRRANAPASRLLWTWRQNKLLILSSLLVALLIAAVIGAPLLTNADPDLVDAPNRLLRPGEGGHPLGTDGFGRDLFARILYGGRVSLGLSVCVVCVNAMAGLIIGSIAAYAGGFLDGLIMRIIDILMAFPSMILSLFIIGVFGSSVRNLFLSLILFGWIGYARMARSLVLSLKEQIFIQSARGIGCRGARLIFRHIIPNVMPTIIIYAAMHIGSTILAIASISFLGLGVQPPTAEWGTMLSDAKQYVSLYSHMVIYPGAALAVSVFAFNLLGDALRDLADPHTKEIIKT